MNTKKPITQNINFNCLKINKICPIVTYVVFISLFLCHISAIAQDKSSQVRSVLPSGIHSEIYFGINLDDFKNVVGNNLRLETTNDTSFRLVYSQKTNFPEITSIIYYFDNNLNKPLYEVIINYQNEGQAQKAAAHLFGNPNHNNTEWRMKIRGFPAIWSWVYKNKLVVVAKIPGSEWFDDWNTY